MKARKHFHCVELCAQTLCLRCEGFKILRLPPVHHVAVCVEVAALIVEPVGHLMTDHNADTAIVLCIRCFRIEERCLKDCCREHDLVSQRIIVSVDGLRCHAPFGAVNGFAPFLQVLFLMPHADVVHVLIVREIGVDLHCAVVFPFVGITDLHGECVELLDSIELGVIAHPVKIDDMFAECRAEVLNKTDHIVFRRLGEVFLNIELTNGLAHGSFCCAERTLPAWTLLLNAAHHLAELKRCIGEVVAQTACGLRNVFPQIIVLDLAVGQRCHQVVGLFHGFDLGDDHLFGRGDLHCFDEEAIPVDVGIHLLELGKRTGIVHCRNVAALFACPGRVGDCCLDLHDVLHDAVGIFLLVAGVHHLFDDQLLISFAHFFVALVVL